MFSLRRHSILNDRDTFIRRRVPSLYRLFHYRQFAKNRRNGIYPTKLRGTRTIYGAFNFSRHFSLVLHVRVFRVYNRLNNVFLLFLYKGQQKFRHFLSKVRHLVINLLSLGPDLLGGVYATIANGTCGLHFAVIFINTKRHFNLYKRLVRGHLHLCQSVLDLYHSRYDVIQRFHKRVTTNMLPIRMCNSRRYNDRYGDYNPTNVSKGYSRGSFLLVGTTKSRPLHYSARVQLSNESDDTLADSIVQTTAQVSPPPSRDATAPRAYNERAISIETRPSSDEA